MMIVAIAHTTSRHTTSTTTTGTITVLMLRVSVVIVTVGVVTIAEDCNVIVVTGYLVVMVLQLVTVGVRITDKVFIVYSISNYSLCFSSLHGYMQIGNMYNAVTLVGSHQKTARTCVYEIAKL